MIIVCFIPKVGIIKKDTRCEIIYNVEIFFLIFIILSKSF